MDSLRASRPAISPEVPAFPAFPALPALLAASILLGGCATVKPWDREKLASPCMQNPFAKSALAGAYEDKLTQTKTAGGLPGDAPGGGCGCVQ